MTQSNLFSQINSIQYALKIREINSESWWVYRHQIGPEGIVSPLSRVVFFCTSLSAAKEWVERQKQEKYVYVLSDN